MATKGSIGVFETLGGEISSSVLHWSKDQTGLAFGGSGVIGVLFLLLFHIIVQYADDLDLVLGGVVIMIVSCLLVLSLAPSSFLASIVLMYAIGYPIGHTALLGWFSKITKQGPQGYLLGWFGSTGSSARILFPLLAGYFVDERYIFGIMAVILLIATFAVFMLKGQQRSVADP
jgi:MFS family permease